MMIELQENGVHIHISVDDRQFPKMDTVKLFEEAKGTLTRLTTGRIETPTVATVNPNRMYL